MSASTKVTANLPSELLERAKRLTGEGVTATLVEGLKEIDRRHKRSALAALMGKVEFDLDLKKTRR